MQSEKCFPFAIFSLNFPLWWWYYAGKISSSPHFAFTFLSLQINDQDPWQMRAEAWQMRAKDTEYDDETKCIEDSRAVQAWFYKHSSANLVIKELILHEISNKYSLLHTCTRFQCRAALTIWSVTMLQAPPNRISWK